MVSDKVLVLSGYVEISSKRLRVMNVLSQDVKMPKNIAEESNILQNHISKILRDMKMHDLVVCINEEARKGRLYRLTPLGVDVKEHLVEKGVIR